jgi:hypothetical protein
VNSSPASLFLWSDDSLLRTDYESAPLSRHFGSRIEGENLHLPSQSVQIRDERGQHTLYSDVTAAMLRSGLLGALGFGEGEYRAKRFTVRKYVPDARDGCDWHTDGCDLSVLFWVGGTFEGGDLVMGEGERCELRIPGSEQRTGSMVVFEGCKVRHTAEPVTKGARYVVVIFLDKKPPPRTKRARLGEISST